MRTKARTAKFPTTAFMAAASLSFIASATAPRAEDIKPEEAHAIAVDAYVYFYPSH
jgi:hypothetical protein